MLITPTGYACGDIGEQDLVAVDTDGQWPEDGLKPSSEWHFHLAVYKAFPEAKAIVHCHSRQASALACLRREIPAFHYMVAMAGGDSIRCADYATFGTEALAQAIVAALQDRKACLMANHGQLAFGNDPDAALQTALLVEDLAAMYLQALQTGEPELLDQQLMAEVLEKFKGYGRQDD